MTYGGELVGSLIFVSSKGMCKMVASSQVNGMKLNWEGFVTYTNIKCSLIAT